MDWRSAGAPEEERRVPTRARGAEDGGRATGPSTVKGEGKMVKKVLQMKRFSLPPHVGPGDALKGASPGFGGGAEPFFSVVLCWQNDKFYECLLGMPSFQSIGGGSVPPPMAYRTLGWAACRQAHRLALAEAPTFFLCRIVSAKR